MKNEGGHPRAVAELGFKAMMKGKPVVIHGTMNKVLPCYPLLLRNG